MAAMMDFDFTGKKVMVTGAGRGIGRGLSKALAEMGAEVFALSKTQANLDSLKAEVPSVHTVCCDLADWDATRKAVEEIDAVDFLVNNAGILTPPALFVDLSQHDLDITYNVNFKAAVNVSQVVARRMISGGKSGVIVNVSSVRAECPAPPGRLAYCTMKAALDMLTKVMALELGSHNIRVVGVRPTLIMTDFFKDCPEDTVQIYKDKSCLGQVGEVKHVVDTIIFLLSDKASLITGSSVDVDAGVLAKH
jgi:L-xylulose reductase